MAPLTQSLLTLLSVALLTPLTSAHGHVQGVVVDGKWYTGWNAEFKYKNPLPECAGWQADNLDNAFIAPSAFASDDIICHKAAKNPNFEIPAKAGSKITFQWNTWPESHRGECCNELRRDDIGEREVERRREHRSTYD